MSYSSIIQKDLPLATWDIEESPSSGGVVACDRFLGSAYNGAYSTGTVQTEKKSPIIFGSSRSVQITANNGGYAFRIPSLDKISTKTINEAVSIEFCLKFYSSTFSSPTSITKIMGKPNSQTGIYIHNSSIIAIVGDTSGNIVKTSVQVPNIKKPLHIVMSYFKSTVYLTVNGQMTSNSKSSEVLTKAYSSSDEYFNFIYPGSGLEYAIDQISLYSRVLDMPTIRRHIAYAFGYEIPNQVARNYGGHRYNLSMSQTPISGKFEKGSNSTWSNPSSISNMTVEKGYLRIEKHVQPQLKYAKDKSSSVFSWDSTSGLLSAAGGYVEISDTQQIFQSSSYGMGFLFYKLSTETKLANGTQSTLAFLNNQYSEERYLRFYLVGTSSGENLNVQIDNNIPVTLLSNSTGKISGDFSFGFYYNNVNQELKTFAGYNTNTGVTGTLSTVSNSTFYPEKIRLCSSPVYSSSESYILEVTSGEDKRFVGGIKRVTHLASAPSTSSLTVTQSAINSVVNNYAAEVNVTEKRFVLKASGSYSFNIDLKKLAGNNESLVGNHRIEWGSSSSEVTVTALGKGYSSEDSWLPSTTLTNTSCIPDLIEEDPGASKYLNITFNILSNDIEDNPAKIYYFRIVTYPTELISGLYTTTISCDGPDMNVNSTVANSNILPENSETPFLFNEEQGGLFVGKTASIIYPSSTIGTSSTSGIRAISLFLNLSSSTTRVFTVTDGTTTYNLTYNGTSFTATGMTPYVDGAQTSTITSNVWHHVVLVFGTRLIVSNSSNLTITFGIPSTGVANFYLDEIMTLDGDSSLTAGEVLVINNLYKGNNFSVVGDVFSNKISIFDSESSDGVNLYQPVFRFASHIQPVNFVVTSKPDIYNSTTDIFIDGQQLVAGDRILVTDTNPGIYTVNTLTKGSAIVGSASSPSNSMVYVTEGSVGAGKYYSVYNSKWYESVGIEKIVSYSTPKTPIRVNSSLAISS